MMTLPNSETRAYIAENADKDAAWLALHPSKDKNVDMTFALKQIEGLRAAKVKFPYLTDFEEVVYPARVSLEQSSSQKTADFKASLVAGKTFADLSGGFAIDTFAFSRKFDSGTYIETDEELCKIAMHNSKVLNISNLEFRNISAEIFLSEMENVDFIYLDPSRRDFSGRKVVELEDCSPNILDIKEQLLGKCKFLMLKLSPMVSISKLLLQLSEIYEIHVVALNGECKEILCLLSGEEQCSRKIFAENIHQNYVDSFSQNIDSLLITPDIADSVAEFVYEPNAAVLKADLQNIYAAELRLKKLAFNSNFFTSNELKNDFQGRKFKVSEVIPFKEKRAKKLFSEDFRAAIISRNFPFSAEKLREMLKIGDDSRNFIIATTLAPDRKILILCERI